MFSGIQKSGYDVVEGIWRRVWVILYMYIKYECESYIEEN